MPSKKSRKQKSGSASPAKKARSRNTTKRPRVPRTPSALRLSPDVSRYIRSLVDDKLIAGLHLPSAGYMGGYTQQSFRLLTQLKTAAGSNITSLYVNPTYLWADFLRVQRVTNNATVTQYAPTALMTNTSTVGSQAWSISGTGWDSLAVAGGWKTTNTQGFTGHVRCHGIKFRIYYVGTEQNKGGQIIVLHNPQDIGLGSLDEGSTLADAMCLASTGLAADDITRLDDAVSIHRITDSFEFVWRPNNLEFKRVNTNFDISESSLAGINLANTEVITEGVMNSSTDVYSQTPDGWTAGFTIRPAAGSAAATSNYYCEIEAMYDMNIHYTDSTAGGASAVRVTHQSTSHPMDESAIRNALATVHNSRSQHAVPLNATSLSLTKVKTAVGAYAKKAAGGAAAALGERAMGALAESFSALLA